MEAQNEKRKLTVEEQIQDMIDKNIQFELYSQEDAKNFLKYNNYYFKLKSYAKNYNINLQTKKYYNCFSFNIIQMQKLIFRARQINIHSVFCDKWLTGMLEKSKISFIEQKLLEVFTRAVRALN